MKSELMIISVGRPSVAIDNTCDWEHNLARRG